jgi:hypothetical protein
VLLALRDYLAKEKLASLEQLARLFKLDANALEPMLDVWIKRGVIEQDTNQKACASTCLGCESVMYYRYLN